LRHRTLVRSLGGILHEVNVDVADNGEIAVRMVKEKDYDHFSTGGTLGLGLPGAARIFLFLTFLVARRCAM
jgi:hypothetical protein